MSGRGGSEYECACLRRQRTGLLLGNASEGREREVVWGLEGNDTVYAALLLQNPHLNVLRIQF